MTNVPLLDLGPQNRALEAQFENAFREVLRSNMFIMGPRLEAFEKDCAAFLGVKHALGVSSGTDALLLALMALDIGEGDEVLLPSFTFFATAGSIARTMSRSALNGEMKAVITISPASVISLATSPTRRMFSMRSASVKRQA